jgi:formate hydrogenlyase subunit 3/multisubunit Na+/H+ antiporter MnhD subunit
MWRVFLNFGRILAIENLEQYLILAFLIILIITFWLSIARRKKKKKKAVCQLFSFFKMLAMHSRKPK